MQVDCQIRHIFLKSRGHIFVLRGVPQVKSLTTADKCNGIFNESDKHRYIAVVNHL